MLKVPEEPADVDIPAETIADLRGPIAAIIQGDAGDLVPLERSGLQSLRL